MFFSFSQENLSLFTALLHTTNINMMCFRCSLPPIQLLIIVSLILQNSIHHINKSGLDVEAFHFSPSTFQQKQQYIIYSIGRTKTTALGLSSSSSPEKEKNEVNDLLDRASKLRKEVEELENLASSSNTNTNKINKNTELIPAPKKTYSELPNSSWELIYRFSKDPQSQDDEQENVDSGKATDVKNPFYTGSIKLFFRDDGYTEFSSKSSSTTLDNKRKSVFEKVWGWDEDVSNEDEKTYLLFSADISFQDDSGKTEKERFYFQAQLDTENNMIKLSDGTITVKRNIEETQKNGKFWWGIFNGGGILAQFVYCGNFSIRAIETEDV